MKRYIIFGGGYWRRRKDRCSSGQVSNLNPTCGRCPKEHYGDGCNSRRRCCRSKRSGWGPQGPDWAARGPEYFGIWGVSWNLEAPRLTPAPMLNLRFSGQVPLPTSTTGWGWRNITFAADFTQGAETPAKRKLPAPLCSSYTFSNGTLY